jgi:MFS family permease
VSGLLSGYVPRGTRLLLASMYLATVPMGYLLVVLPLYLSRAGLEPAFIGLLYTVSGIVSAGLVAFSGAFADRWGRRRFLVAGTLLPIPSYLILSATTDPGWLVAASVLGGVGLANGAAGALTIASFDAMLSERAGEAVRTRVFAAGQALWSLAMATGSLAAAVPALLRALLPGASEPELYRGPFLAMVVLTLTAAWLLLPVRDDPTVRLARAASGWWPSRSRQAIATYGLAIGFLGFGLGIAVQLMPLWFNLRFGVSEADLGPWYAAAQILSFGTVALVPALEGRLGAPRTVMLALSTAGACLALIVIAPAFIVAAALFVVRGFVTNLSWPFHQSLLMGATVPEERATAVGAGFAVWGLANAAGPFAAGAFLGAGAFVLPLLVGAVMYALGGVVFGVGFERIRRRAAVAAVAAPAAD